MGLFKGTKTFSFEIYLEDPILHCNAFEDKSGAIEISHLLKMCPHTKHINIVFHNFHGYIHKGLIHIQQVCTDDQCADTCTKPLPLNVFFIIAKWCLVYNL